MRGKFLLRSVGAAIVLALLWSTAYAHHSYAMFEKRQVVVKGTVKSFSWTNPHIFLLVSVPDADGNIVDWGAEGSGLGDLARQGWKFNSLKEGDKVTIGIAPLRDGRPGGGLIYVLKADGSRLSGGPLDRLLNSSTTAPSSGAERGPTP